MFLMSIFSSHLVEFDIVGGEQAGFATKVAEPPVVVGEFLQKGQYRNGKEADCYQGGCGVKLTMPVIFPPSGKLSSFSSAAS